MVIVFAIFAAQVVPDPEAPALFFDGNNYQEYRPAFKKLFPREGNPSQIKAQVGPLLSTQLRRQIVVTFVCLPMCLFVLCSAHGIMAMDRSCSASLS